MLDDVLQLELPGGNGPWAAATPPAFVVGPENALVSAPLNVLLHTDDWAEATRRFNPLVLAGPSGSGKTALARAIIRSWRQRLGGDAVAYFSVDDFNRELQIARGDDQLARWRTDLHQTKLLVVEDLARLRRGSAAYLELRQACDAVVEGGGLVVLTVDREPALLRQLDAGMRDRLAAGLTLRLVAPGPDARRRLMRLAAEHRGLALSPAEVELLSRQEAPDVASLLARFDQCLNGAARPESGEQTASHVPIKQILAVVARHFGVTQAALVGPSRRKSLVVARNAAAYLARRLTPLSYGHIGVALGRRDHTTIMHAERRLAESLDADPVLQQSIEQLQRLLEG